VASIALSITLNKLIPLVILSNPLHKCFNNISIDSKIIYLTRSYMLRFWIFFISNLCLQMLAQHSSWMYNKEFKIRKSQSNSSSLPTAF
jgi:hypothetical protein